MAKGNGHSDQGSALTAAAAALETELHRYTELAQMAVRVPLTSEKNVDRAARAIVDAAESEKRVLGHVQSLVQAISAAREAQQASASAVSAHGQAVAEKRAALDALLARFEKLGEVAKTLNAAVQKIAGYKGNPYAGGEEANEMQEAIAAMETGMATCAEHAQLLAADAHTGGFEELGRQAEGLRQQILSVKNRLSLLNPLLKKSLEEKPQG